ncbi:MAG TPA: osmoprotectant NAGGN system M42 family peptidase [Thermohalobaculum sp.]|nr:osmoprotectant NAGGN system M42 family peptidase [Thermohalobaculum sp.]
MTLPKIDLDYLKTTLRKLLLTPSPTGYTDEATRLVARAIGDLGYEYEVTRRGAIRARMPGSRREGARAIVSHVDTLGAQVKWIGPDGRLELVPIGHWSSRFAEGARATVFTDKGGYRGTILPLKASGHTFGAEIDTQPVAWDQVRLRVDALCRNVTDAMRLGIEIGDIVAIDPQPEFLDNGYIVSRHLDDKAGVAVMLAAMKAMAETPEATLPVDVLWLFTIAEEVGHGASSVLTPEVASLVAIDNGTTARGQNSNEFGVTISMADMTGPFDWHLTRKLARLCREHDIRFQKDVFRHYRSDAAAAIEGGADVRPALICFGVDASHGYERIHMHALRSLAELACAYVTSPVEISRDRKEIGSLRGFTHQPLKEAEQPPPSNMNGS